MRERERMMKFRWLEEELKQTKILKHYLLEKIWIEFSA